MHTTARTAGFTFAASLGLHGLILLLAAWVGAVLPSREPVKVSGSAPGQATDSAARCRARGSAVGNRSA